MIREDAKWAMSKLGIADAVRKMSSSSWHKIQTDLKTESLKKGKKGGGKSKMAELDTNASLSEFLSAAITVYKFLYSPKGTINEQNSSAWDKTRRSCVAWSFLFATLGVIVAIAENEVLWANQRVPGQLSFLLKWLNVVCSCVAIYFLHSYYRACIALERLRGLPLHHGAVSVTNLVACGLWETALLDLLCMLPQPIPYLHVDIMIGNEGLGDASEYQIDQLLLVLMFLRIRLLPRFYGDCVTDISNEVSYAIGNMSGVSVDEGFIFKFLMNSSIRMVLLLWTAQVLFFAYCLLVFERPEALNPMAKADLQFYPNCIWCTVITMTIVGYGDTYPSTRFGRVTMMFASVSAVVMVAITTNIVKIYLDMTRVELRAVSTMESIALRDHARVQAACLIQATYRAYRKVCNRDEAIQKERETALRKQAERRALAEHDRKARLEAKGVNVEGGEGEVDESESEDEEMDVVLPRRRRLKVIEDATLQVRLWNFIDVSKAVIRDRHAKSGEEQIILGEGKAQIQRMCVFLESAGESLESASEKLEGLVRKQTRGGG